MAEIKQVTNFKTSSHHIGILGHHLPLILQIFSLSKLNFPMRGDDIISIFKYGGQPAMSPINPFPVDRRPCLVP